MVWLASYANKGISQASLSTMFTLLMSLFFPPVFFLNGALIGFLFLTKTTKDFFKILTISILVSFVILEIKLGSGIIVLGLIILWAPILLGSYFVKKYNSLSIGLEFIVIGILLMVTSVVLVAGDMQTYWTDVVQQVFSAENMRVEEQAVLQSLLEEHATNMTGWLSAGILLGSVISLLIARHWQKVVLLNERFTDEFVTVKFSKTLTIIGLVIFVVSFFYKGLVFENLNPVIIIAFFFVGVAIAHTFVAKKMNNLSWLVVFYFVLILIFPLVSLFLAVIGMTDYWFQYRKMIK